MTDQYQRQKDLYQQLKDSAPAAQLPVNQGQIFTETAKFLESPKTADIVTRMTRSSDTPSN